MNAAAEFSQQDLERLSTTQVSAQRAPDTAQVCVWDATGSYFCERKDAYMRQSASKGVVHNTFEGFAAAFGAKREAAAAFEGFCGCGADIPN